MGEIVGGINNLTLDINLVTQDNKKVNYTIISKDIKKGEIVAKLDYENPQKISASSDPDIIQATITESIKVTS